MYEAIARRSSKKIAAVAIVEHAIVVSIFDERADEFYSIVC